VEAGSNESTNFAVYQPKGSLSCFGLGEGLFGGR
jgi:hypothetical protein